MRRRCRCRCCNYYNYRNYNNISKNEMFDLINNYNSIIIDVRTTQEYNEGHIEGAYNIPLMNLKVGIESLNITKNQYIVVYCSSGVRSKKAQMKLQQMGFTNVYNLVLN